MRHAIGVLNIMTVDFWDWVSRDYDFTKGLAYKSPVWDSLSQQLILYPVIQEYQTGYGDYSVYIDGVELWCWIHDKYFKDGMERIFDENNFVFPKDDEIIIQINYAESDYCDPLSWSDDFKPNWLKNKT